MGPSDWLTIEMCVGSPKHYWWSYQRAKAEARRSGIVNPEVSGFAAPGHARKANSIGSRPWTRWLEVPGVALGAQIAKGQTASQRRPNHRTMVRTHGRRGMGDGSQLSRRRGHPLTPWRREVSGVSTPNGLAWSARPHHSATSFGPT